MPTNHRTRIDPQVLTHLQRIEARAPAAQRVVAWIASLGCAALIGLIGVIVLPTATDLTEQAPAHPVQETT